MIAGMVLMALAVVGVVVAVAVFGGRLDLEGFNRDVAITGAADQEVPGSVGFRVIESLSSEKRHDDRRCGRVEFAARASTARS